MLMASVAIADVFRWQQKTFLPAIFKHDTTFGIALGRLVMPRSSTFCAFAAAATSAAACRRLFVSTGFTGATACCFLVANGFACSRFAGHFL